MYIPSCVWGALLTLFVNLAVGHPADTYRNPMCVRSNASCAQDNSCFMVYHPVNSSICSAIPYKQIITQAGQLSLGGLRLETYLFVNKILHQTAFNITFENITWTHMQFRISLNGNSGKNTCREFVRSGNSSVTSLSYDCLWSDERYEGKPFILEYEARSGDKIEAARLSFIVPFAVGIKSDVPRDQWHILVYVDSIPSQLGRTKFILHWKPMPETFDVESYEILAFSNETIQESEVIGQVQSCGDDFCSFTTQRWFGTVKFGVRPIFKDKSHGFISRTPLFVLGADSTRPLLLGIVSCSVILPALFYILFVLRNYIVRRSVRKSPPKVLLVHSPSTTPHLHMVEALAHYLNTHCNVIAMMDEIDIPISSAKDPFLWCNEAMLSAEIVVVVASPHYKYLRSTAALYRTDRLLLRLLRERLGTNSKTQFCVLMPSYTTSVDIPFEAAGLRRYRLPEDLDQLLRLMRFELSLPSFLSVGVSVDRPTWTERSQELTECLAAAAQDLRENSADYLQQVEKAKVTENKTEDLMDRPKSPKIFEDWNPFEGKKERILLAEETLGVFPGNLDTLNLLGESEECPMVQNAQKLESSFDLDQLNL